MVDAITGSQLDAAAARLQGARLRSLKAKTNYTNSWRFAVRHFLYEVVQDSLAWFLLVRNRYFYSCEKYGHVLPARGWKVGSVPTCGHCGAQVRGIADLGRSLSEFALSGQSEERHHSD
jgi:hypothetical protein